MEKVKVICLCGSRKFEEEFISLQTRLTLEGNVVLTPLFSFYNVEVEELTKEQISVLKNLHLKRIEVADEVLVINKDGYIGESTKAEIEYATMLNKKINYLQN